jgi:hypothetical protein
MPKTDCFLLVPAIGRNGAQLYTVDMKGPAGTDHLSPVVMIHGFGMGLAFWARQLDDFAKHRRVIAFDLPGMGCSDRPAYNGSTLKEAEDYFIGAIYDWQKAMGIRELPRSRPSSPYALNQRRCTKALRASSVSEPSTFPFPSHIHPCADKMVPGGCFHVVVVRDGVLKLTK